ncbi:hypothetical protein SELMODRAFT_120802 [Selaginella moellendorffii]|uniref:CAF17 C-terminal domain-containing protein n=1 Tax=Selaginella moellendorffii TaxID=88036 RepID=D8SMW0_SELML|nr:hypothetical protein SELMODRAFT_120802 [Selaginella moellendorffii]
MKRVNVARVFSRLLAQNAPAAESRGAPSDLSSSGATALADRGPFASHLKSRAVLGFDGDDTFKFLQGLATNDVLQLEADEHSAKLGTPTPNQPGVVQPPIYTGILNPQGRFLFDMFLYKPVQESEKLGKGGDAPGAGKSVPQLVADVDAASFDDLIAYLKRYILRSKVNIEDLSKDLCAWQRFGGALAGSSTSETGAGNIGWAGGRDLSGTTAAEGNGNGWRWFKDPRLDALGFRGVFSSGITPPLIEADQEVDEEYYLLWRLEQGVPEGPAEIPGGEAIPLEYNMAALNAISFEKGCYVGQELIARTHYRGEIRKRLMPVNFVLENGEEMREGVARGTEIVDGETGKKVGSVITALGSRGLAMVRLEAAAKDRLKLQSVDGGCGASVKPIRPKWWPSQWGTVE